MNISTAVTVKYENVLLVDDNPVDNLVNRELINQSGFSAKTQVLESAKATLEFLKTASDDELPQLIFLDILMPGMDGFQFLDEFALLDERIRTRCKIVMLSSSDSFKDLNRANKNIFVRRFLNKPLTVEMLNAINF